jgi:hypothetical protein
MSNAAIHAAAGEADAEVVPEPERASTFADLLIDFFRLYDPDRLPMVPDLLATQADAAEGVGVVEQGRVGKGGEVGKGGRAVGRVGKTKKTHHGNDHVDNHNGVTDGRRITRKTDQQDSRDKTYKALSARLEEEYNVPGFFAIPEFHFGGRFFDPLKCLYEPHLVPPVPSARPLDSLYKAQGLLPPPRVASSSSSSMGAGSAYGAASAGTGSGHGGAGGGFLVRFGVLHAKEVEIEDARWKQGEFSVENSSSSTSSLHFFGNGWSPSFFGLIDHGGLPHSHEPRADACSYMGRRGRRKFVEKIIARNESGPPRKLISHSPLDFVSPSSSFPQSIVQEPCVQVSLRLLQM